MYALSVQATGAVACSCTLLPRGSSDGDYNQAQTEKAQRAKHTSDPISPAPGTLLSTAFYEREWPTVKLP